MRDATTCDAAGRAAAGRDVRWLLEAACRRGPDTTYATWHPFDSEPRTLTYGELLRSARSFAAGLRHRGATHGDRVLLVLDNCPEFLIAWFGCALAGAVAVTVNPRHTVAELRSAIERTKPIGAISSAATAATVVAATEVVQWLLVTADDGQGNHRAPTTDGEHFERFLSSSDPEPTPPVDPLDPCAVQFTSGTTALPKGVVWTHANAIWAARTNARHQALHTSDVHLVHLPLFHTNALAYASLAALWAGSRIVLVPKFSRSRFWTIAVREQATWTSMVPFTRQALLDTDVPRHTFRWWGDGACHLSTDERFGVTSLGWWGMTETISHPIVGDIELPNRPLSMGRPAPEYAVAILDEDRRPVPPDSDGRLWVRGIPGVSLFAGYLDDAAATEAAFAEDWFDSGDIVHAGSDGSIFFRSRAGDMLKVGGENVSPLEIELFLTGLPGVAEAAIVGRSDPLFDEVPVAFVVPSNEALPDLQRTILDRCREGLSPHKIPREVRVVDSLPKATIGKVAKGPLRELVAATATRLAPPLSMEDSP